MGVLPNPVELDHTVFSEPLAVHNDHYLVRSRFQRHDTVLRIARPDNPLPDSPPRIVFVLPTAPGVYHGSGDGLDSFLRADLHNRFNLVAVSPYYSDWPWYADHPFDPRQQQVKYFIDDIVPFVDGLFPNHQRLLLGFSKSGTGSFQFLLRSPELFDAIAIFDSPLMKMSPDQWEMPDLFGSQKNFDAYAIPTLLRERGHLLGPDARIALYGYGNFGKNPPDWTIDHISAAHELMDELGIPHIYSNDTYREHRWDSGWMESAVEALDQMSRALGNR